MGSLASIENLSEVQGQRILRGHDMQVSALAVSPSGRYIASGQIGTKNFKGCAGFTEYSIMCNMDYMLTSHF